MRLKWLLVCSLGAFAAACSSAPAPGPAAGAGKSVDAATAGTVTGRIGFDGAPPAPQPLKMTSDPACAESSGPNPMSDAVVVNNGALQNVFVYVSEGLDPAYRFDVPTQPLKFDQRGVRIGAADLPAASLESSPAVVFEEQHVVRDDARARAGQKIDDPGVQQPRPRPRPEGRLERAQR